MSKTLGKPTKTCRGFPLLLFKDRYDVKCSLQASSLADYELPGTSAVWLGVEHVEPKCLHGDAKALGVKTDATCGWVPYPIPDQVLLTSRMHLDRKQVAALIVHLQRWLEHGKF